MRHVETVHELDKDNRYPCDKCDYEATTESTLKRHKVYKHEDFIDLIHCGQCNYNTTVKGSLKQHVESIHEGVRYPCDQCDYKATQKGNLRTHMKKMHK